MRFVGRLVVILTSVFGLALFAVPPASATVHEIVAQWCSGHDPLAPPGVSDPTKGNFAKPLEATGFLAGVVPFQDGFLVAFDYGVPAAKVVGTGEFVVIGEVEEAPLYLELIEPSPDFPAFQRCPRLVG